MRKYWLFLFVVLMPIQSLLGNDEAKKEELLAGHSYHGEAFNEGPRQKPYLMPGLGQSQFKISTSDETAQSYFNQGIDQLHGFWYFEAERSFRQVATLDPGCAMAYWGLAMANVNNEDRAKKFLKEARQKLMASDRTTSNRESLYIAALESFYSEQTKDEKKRAINFVKKLEEIVLKFPNDIEAKAFLACQVWMNKRKKVEISSHIGINSILDDIFEQNPHHPAHHYRIHLWDYENAEVAVHSAANCGQSLPAIAHMWHMPGHIFSRLKRYEDAVWQQEASARVDHHHMMHDWVLPDQIHNFAHNNEWCIRNLIHVGRVQDAVNLATNMISLPRHPKYNVLDDYGSARYGRQRLFQVLSTYEQWDSLLEACQNGLLAETDLPLEKIKRLRLMGRAYFRSEKLADGERILKQLEDEKARVEREKKEAEQAVKQTAAEQTSKLVTLHNWIKDKLPQRIATKYDASFRNSLRRDHRKRVNRANAESTKPLDDQLNVIRRATDEMLGYQDVAQGKFAEALKKLKKAGEVDAIYRAYVQHKAGDTEMAIEAAEKFVKSKQNEVQPLAMLTWLLWECGRRDAATEKLCQLRETSNSIDIACDFFDKLAPVVAYAGLESDWRINLPTADDIGNRPALDDLGPFRWQPIQAPSWELLDSRDQPISLHSYSGKPVIVIFYLGHGCLHCAEQLQAFAPKLNNFLEAGIEVVAISTDDRKGLKISIDSYGEVPLPIQLLANPEMDVFRLYRAFDEFENQPLHGTFLLDAERNIRWQDISYEPFMDPDFLLKESKRLLGIY